MIFWADSRVLLFALAFALSLGAGLLIVFTNRWHLRFSADDDDGVQKVHTRVTPRVGGVSLMFTLWLVWKWGMKMPSLELDLTNLPELLWLFLLASLPAFAFGLMEDLTGRIGILSRLMATMVSGLMAWWVSGDLFDSFDTWGLDTLLAYTPIALAFTVLAVATVANGFNIIDGFNGLSSGIATLAFLAFSFIAHIVGDADLHLLCLIFAGASLGFFVINWPWGRLFLGDGGAYLLGFLLAWVAVMLKSRHGEINAYSLVLVLMLPLTELLFTVYRRIVRKQHPGHPDRLHLHSLVKRRFVNHVFASQGRLFRNSATGFLIVLLGSLGQILACFTLYSVAGSVLALVALVLFYLFLYARILYFAWVPPWTLFLPANSKNNSNY